MEKIYDVIIIGGGPAGYSAALYAARSGMSTLVVEKMGAGGQMALTDIIDNYPGFDDGIDGVTLGMKMQAGAERFGAETLYASVISAKLEGKVKCLRTTSADLSAKTVVIATGAEPRKLGIKGEDALVGRGLHYCAHCDGRFYKGKTVMVVGGGNSAVSDALYLSKLAKRVILVHRRDTLRATKIYHDPLMKSQNVDFMWNSVIDNFILDPGLIGAKVRNLETGESEDVCFDGLFVSIGRKPSTELFENQVAVDSNGYIIAGEDTKTSIDGVYAAGDVRTKNLRQVVTAAADGAVAAYSAEHYINLTEK